MQIRDKVTIPELFICITVSDLHQIYQIHQPGASFEGAGGQLPPRPKLKIMCSAKLPTRVATKDC